MNPGPDQTDSHEREERSMWELLAQDARVLRRARMLPNDRTLSTEEAAAVAADFKKYVREQRLKLTEVSKELGEGYSPSLLSEFAAGKGKGDVDRIARGVNQWMELRARDVEVAKPRGFVETEVAERILLALGKLRAKRGFGIITGPAGAGKTITAQAARVMFPGSVYIRIGEGEGSRSGLRDALIEALNVKGVKGKSLRDRIRGLVKVLSGSSRLLMLDQAHELTAPALRVLMDLVDETDCPVALLGTHDIHAKMDDSEMWFGQLSSRVRVRCNLASQAARSNDPRPLYTVDEIRRVFATGKIRLTDDGARFLCKVSNVLGLGCLRFAASLVMDAAGLKKYEGKPIDAKILAAVLRHYHGEEHAQITTRRVDDLRVRVA